MVKKLHVIKIGGNVIDDETQLQAFLQNVSEINEMKVLIHGGGKLATDLADTLRIKQTMIDGRRVTDAKTLEITIMVYAGLINKNIVAKLQALKCNAIGLSGADGNLITSAKRKHTKIDFGYVGDIVKDGIDIMQFQNYIESGMIPVICPITHDGKGNLLNTNADTMASKIAASLSRIYDVSLTFCFEKNGVLGNVNEDDSLIPTLNKQHYLKLKSDGMISKGMVPKLDNAFESIDAGVGSVTICHAKNIKETNTGTQLKK